MGPNARIGPAGAGGIARGGLAKDPRAATEPAGRIGGLVASEAHCDAVAPRSNKKSPNSTLTLVNSKDEVMTIPRRRVESATLKFARWFFQPLETLRRLPADRGAFVAIMVSLVLYERYAKTVLVKRKQKADKKGLCRILAADFGITHDQAVSFWGTIRDGFLHQGMPLQGGNGRGKYPKWAIALDADDSISFDSTSSESVIVIHPWRFMDDVVSLFRMNPHLIDSSPSFPWASTFGSTEVIP
jgi:hypothetical protein